MTDTDKPEQAPEDTSAIAGPPLAPKSRQALAKMRRELSEEELSQSGVQRMLLEELYRLDGEVAILASFRERFHQSDKRVAVLEEKRRKSIAWGVVSTVCLTVGAALLAFSTDLWKNQPFGWLSVGTGVLLIGCGIGAQVLQQWT